MLFPQNVAEPVAVIFPREVLEEDGDLKKRMIGTGPYILKEHTRKVRVVLQRNPDYWDKGRPYIDEYVILSTPDAATRLAAFRTGQSDFIWVASPSEVEALRKTNPNAVVQAYHNIAGAVRRGAGPGQAALQRRAGPAGHLDGHRPPEAGGHGVRGPRHHRLGRALHLLPGHAAHARKDFGPWWQYRPAEAKKLLAEAGHRTGFETTLFYYEYFPQMTSQVQLVQQDLKRNLNINVKITKLDYTTYYGRYVEGKWDGMAWGFQSGHAIGLDERTYQYMHSRSTEELLPGQRPGHRRADHQAAADARPRRAARAHQEDRRSRVRPGAADVDAVRQRLPGLPAAHAQRGGAGAAAHDGYGSPTLARIWLDK